MHWFKKKLNEFKKIFKNNYENEKSFIDKEKLEIKEVKEFKTLTHHHNIELEKKPKIHKHKIKRKLKLRPTIDHKEKKSKKLIIKLPENRKIK